MAIPLPPLSFGFSPKTSSDARGGSFGASSKFGGALAINTAAGGTVSATAQPNVGSDKSLMMIAVLLGAIWILKR